MKRSLEFFVVALCSLAQSAALLACPAYISASKISQLSLKARKDLRVFALEVSAGKRAWLPLPLQIDELDEKGILTGSNPNQAPNDTDRISLRVEKFGARISSADKAPCSGQQAIEIENPSQPGRYAYLTTCNDEYSEVSEIPVTHDAELKKVSSVHYDYEYLPNNQLMYKSLIAKDSSWLAPIPAASNADLALHLDIKRFLTVNFSNKDVESYVGRRVSGQVGMVGNIDFFLRLLFMKIDLKLGTTVGFYGDSAHIPSIIDVPVDAFSKLNQGSGLLYQWQLEKATMDQIKPEKTMPNANPALVKEGWESYAKDGLKYCSSDSCSYQLRGSIGSLPFGIDIYLAKSIVSRGFYPVWVADAGQFKKDMGWSNDDSDNGRVGIFFNNGGLAKGQYPMNQWIRLGSGGMLGQCPAPVMLGSMVMFNDGNPNANKAH